MRDTLTVSLSRRAAPWADPFELFVRLRHAYGDDEVFLLESLSGPDVDSNRALVGVLPIADVIVARGAVRITGTAPVADWMRARLAASQTVEPVEDGSFALADPTDVWDALRVIQSGFEVHGANAHSFGFGFLTVLGYDTIGYIERLPQRIEASTDTPDMVFRLYAATIEVDLPGKTATLITASATEWDAVDADRMLAAAADATASDAASTSPERPDAPGQGVAPQFTMQRDEYVDRAVVALDRIHVGDIYQVQVGHEVRITTDRRDLDVYRRLRDGNPSPYMAFLPLDGITVISGSPELHVRVQDGELLMRPIAGTARRTADEEENARNTAWLLGDEKEVAEHIMLVDLCRNDLGRVAVPGSVTVDELMLIERYSHVFHLVSTVSARLDDESDVYDVIRATFPAGTMTGTPKIRAMEIIESLEKSRRGLYAGVFGVIGFGGFVNLALSIRSITAVGDTYTTRASAGVVVDSRPESEWLETLAKMGATVRAISGRDLA